VTKFSETRQPERRHGIYTTCRKGHSMAEGNPNVRVRGDGQRVCRVCESDRRRQIYHEQKKIRAGVLKPFTLENPYYDVEVYEHTSVDILKSFYDWQGKVLVNAKEKPTGEWKSPNGEVIKAATVVEMLEREMPILAQHILERMKA